MNDRIIREKYQRNIREMSEKCQRISDEYDRNIGEKYQREY